MRYLTISFVVFIIFSIYHIVKEIIRTKLIIQEVGREGVSTAYNLAGALGEATSFTMFSLPLILILYFFMTRNKSINTISEKYPKKFILSSIVIMLTVLYLHYIGGKNFRQSETERRTETANIIREKVRNDRIEHFKSKINEYPKSDIYAEIEGKGVNQFVIDFVAGSNKEIKRNQGSVRIDELTTQHYTVGDENIVTYNYTILKQPFLKYYDSNNTDIHEELNSIISVVEETNKKRFCSYEVLRIMMEKGVEFNFSYKFDDGTPLPSYKIVYKDCNIER